MRLQLIGLMLLASILGILLTLYLRSILERFKKSVVCIETEGHFEEFKKIAKTTMYGSLVQMVFLFLPLVTYLLGLAGSVLLFFPDVLFIVIPSGVYLLLLVRFKSLESQVQSMNIDSQELLQEFIHVVDIWKKQSLPKW